MRLPGVIAPGRATNGLVELVDVVPTILDLCRCDTPANIHGKSLVPLLRGVVDRHRDHVIAEYADNAEAMVRTDRWKLVYLAGNRRRRDCYAVSPFPLGRSICLYDVVDDPGELKDVAGSSGNDAVVGELVALLAAHMRRTARDADLVPQTDDLHAILAACLPPGQPW